MEINKIYTGDCLEVLKGVESNSVDLILADPPYNISKENDRRDRSKLNSPIMRRKKELNYDFGEWDNMDRESFLVFSDNWLKECCRVLRDGGTIISFFSKEDISYLGWKAKEFDIRTRTVISWHKTNPVPSFRKVNYLSACEFIWVGSKGKKAWTFNFQQQKQMHNFFETGNSSGYGVTSHPTEKPETLIKWLLTIHTNEGDLVLDPFLGSGTTAVACKELGRNYIGIELNPEYVKIAEGRLRNTTPPLFNLSQLNKEGK